MDILKDKAGVILDFLMVNKSCESKQNQYQNRLGNLFKQLGTVAFTQTGVNSVFVGDYFQSRINTHLVFYNTAAGCM